MKAAWTDKSGATVASLEQRVEPKREQRVLDPLTPITPPPSRIEDAIRQARPLSLDPLSPLRAPRPAERWL